MSIAEYLNAELKRFTKDGVVTPNIFHETFAWKDADISKGVQGILGLIEFKHGSEFKKAIYKISKDFDFTVRHEGSVMKSLNDLSSFCPYFCQFYSLFKYPVYDRFTSEDTNPFKESEHIVNTDVLLTEYVPGSVSFTSQLKKMKPQEVFSTIQQVMIALEIGQRFKKFSHFDLHTDNILITRVPEEVYVFHLDDNTTFWVYNNGILPKIIDFGYSHTVDIKNGNMYGSLEHTDAGYLTVVFDPIVDLKVFLTGISYDLSRISGEYDDLRDFIKDELYVLHIDKKSGWDRDEDYSLVDDISALFEDSSSVKVKDKYGNKKRVKSSIFSENSVPAVTTLQGLIQLPFKDTQRKNRNTQDSKEELEDSITESAERFIEQFIHFENSVTNDFHRLYILYVIVDILVSIQHKGYNNSEKAKYLMKELFQRLYNVIPFYDPPEEVDYLKMIDSLNSLSSYISSYYYKEFVKIRDHKESMYKRLSFKTPGDLLRSIEKYYGKYNFTSETKMRIYDARKNVSYLFPRPLSDKEVEKLNTLSYVEVGDYIRKLKL